MCGAEMGRTQDKVSLLLTSGAISVQQETEAHLDFFFKVAHLVRDKYRGAISPKHQQQVCNSALQLQLHRSFSFSGTRLEVVKVQYLKKCIEIWQKKAKNSDKFELSTLRELTLS